MSAQGSNFDVDNFHDNKHFPSSFANSFNYNKNNFKKKKKTNLKQPSALCNIIPNQRKIMNITQIKLSIKSENNKLGGRLKEENF